VNDEPLCATAVIQQIVLMHNSAGAKWSYAISFVITDIAHYNMILSMVWLQKKSSDIQWDSWEWH
jgi:hypothetical protein